MTAPGCPCGCASRPYARDPECSRRPRAEVTAAAAGPSTYGLTARELTAEIRRRHADGWARWELSARFADPRTAVGIGSGVAA